MVTSVSCKSVGSPVTSCHEYPWIDQYCSKTSSKFNVTTVRTEPRLEDIVNAPIATSSFCVTMSSVNVKPSYSASCTSFEYSGKALLDSTLSIATLLLLASAMVEASSVRPARVATRLISVGQSGNPKGFETPAPKNNAREPARSVLPRNRCESPKWSA